MSFDVHAPSGAKEAAEFIASAILDNLASGKKVLFFATGGSSIEAAARMSEILRGKKNPAMFLNLTITLTDERYGPEGHPDSNWSQLSRAGFNVPGAKPIPILSGGDSFATVEKFDSILKQELSENDYKIGLFGIGADGHTAGILPESAAVSARTLVYGYKTEKFERITITPECIARLDQAVVFMKGEEKWPVLEELKKDLEVSRQPAQALKRVSSLTIFTDYQK